MLAIIANLEKLAVDDEQIAKVGKDRVVLFDRKHACSLDGDKVVLFVK